MKRFSNRRAQWINMLQNWLTSSLFSLVLCYFILRLLGIPTQNMLSFGLRAMVFCAIFGLGLQYWRYSFPVLGLFGLLALLSIFFGWHFSFPLLSSSFWQALYQAFIDAVQWAATPVAEQGMLPAHFHLVLVVLSSLFSTASIWGLPIPLLNMAFLIVPLFYMEDLAADPMWLFYLLAGLLCVYSSYAYRQDPSEREQRPPIFFGAILIAATFVLQILIPPQFFFNSSLSKALNDIMPMSGGEVSGFSLRELGYYPQGNLRVGGPVTLSDAPYLTVQADSDSFYLRGNAYDQFDGHRWTKSAPQILTDYESRSNYFDTFDSFQAKTFWFEDAASRDHAFEQRELVPMFYAIRTENPTHTVFHGGKPVLVARSSQDSGTEFQAFASEAIQQNGHFLFSENGALVSKETYETYGIQLLDAIAPIENSWLLFEQEEGALSEDLLRPERGEAPHALEAEVREGDPALARILYDENRSFSELVWILRLHFNETYRYELNVDNISDTESFLTHFMRTRQGYCVYFATAWAQLLQDIGYRARYAEGFVVPAAPIGEGQVEATRIERTLSAAQAHAWIEVYIEGFGWYPIETTPTSHVSQLSGINPLDRSVEESVEEVSEESTSQESQSSSTAEDSSSSSSPQESSGESSDEQPTDRTNDADASRFGIAIAVLLILLILWNIRQYLMWRQRRRISQTLNRYKKLNSIKKSQLCRNILRHTERCMRHLGASPGCDETLLDEFTLWKSILHQDELIDQAYEIYESLQYGGRIPEAAQLEVLITLFIAADDLVQHTAKKTSWWFTNILLVKGAPW